MSPVRVISQEPVDPAATFVPEPDLTPALADVVARAFDRLTPAPARVVPVAPGASPIADDCVCGYLYGRVVTIAPALAQARPSKADGTMTCAVLGLDATVAVGVFRCAATVTDTGAAPSAQAVTDNGQQALSDMRAVLQAVLATPSLRSFVGWTPLEVEGDCHGGEWTFTLRLPVPPVGGS